MFAFISHKYILGPHFSSLYNFEEVFYFYITVVSSPTFTPYKESQFPDAF